MTICYKKQKFRLWVLSIPPFTSTEMPRKRSHFTTQYLAESSQKKIMRYKDLPSLNIQ